MADPQPYPTYPYAPASTVPPTPPVPSGRLVPYFWAGALILLTIAAVALAVLAPFTVTRAPAASGTAIYQNSLVQSDSAWQLRNDATGQCSYANGGLDATSSANNNGLVKTCVLSSAQPSDLRLGVTILPQVSSNALASAAIFIHSSLVFYFPAPGGGIPAGAFGIFDGQSSTDIVTPLNGETVEWHGSGALSNSVVITAQSDQYALYINNVEVWNGVLDSVSTSGNIGLGVFAGAGDVKDEAVFSDFSLANP